MPDVFTRGSYRRGGMIGPRCEARAFLSSEKVESLRQLQTDTIAWGCFRVGIRGGGDLVVQHVADVKACGLDPILELHGSPHKPVF